jgi:predicted site-specific integrase-resolvase
MRVAARDATPDIAVPVAAPLMSVADVAAARGVTPGTVRSWVHRGKLQPAQRDRNGRALFHRDAVAQLDKGA